MQGTAPIKVLQLGDEYYTVTGPLPAVGEDGIPVFVKSLLADGQVVTLQELSMKDLKNTGFMLDEEENKKTTKKKEQRGSKSAYAIFMSQQRSTIADNMETLDGVKPKTTDVMKQVALQWADLKTKAKAGDPDASTELQRLKSLAAEEKAAWHAKVGFEAKKPVKKTKNTIKKKEKTTIKRSTLMISMSDLESSSPTDGVPMEKGEMAEWFRKGIESSDWRPGNKGPKPIWYLAGMSGMTEKDYRQKKRAEKKKAMKGGVEDVDSSDSDSEKQPAKIAD